MEGLPNGFVPEFPAVIDSTMVSDFISCPQKFFQGYIRKRSLRGESVHLVAGGAFAKGMEVVRNLVYGPEKLPIDDALIEMMPIVTAEYGRLEPGERNQNKSLYNVLRAVVAYFDRYPPTQDVIQPVMKQNGYPATEFRFSLPLDIKHPVTGNPIIYAGRSDLLGNYSNSMWIVDEKTTTKLGDAWGKQWALRGQLTGYVFAAQQYGFPVVGAIVRGISFLPTGAFGFAEPIEYRSPWQIERWWVQLHRNVARMINCWEESDDKNPFGYWDWALADACTAYGGCPFMSLCKVSDPDAWDLEYEFRDWNPLDANPVGKKPLSSQFFSS